MSYFLSIKMDCPLLFVVGFVLGFFSPESGSETNLKTLLFSLLGV